jgi:hypothetical protein
VDAKNLSLRRQFDPAEETGSHRIDVDRRTGEAVTFASWRVNFACQQASRARFSRRSRPRSTQKPGGYLS